IIYGIALYMGLAPSDLKGVTAVIVVAFIVYNNVSLKRLSTLKEKREENVKN
ncbi:MAG: ABC transporter permease, partial [Peptoniphilus rhinitidis]|nr:ABC transporter permease [Peptoniphilus rhinitidis]